MKSKHPWKLMWCRIVGHRVDIYGLTGRYVWCSRCATRFDADILCEELI